MVGTVCTKTSSVPTINQAPRINRPSRSALYHTNTVTAHQYPVLWIAFDNYNSEDDASRKLDVKLNPGSLYDSVKTVRGRRGKVYCNGAMKLCCLRTLSVHDLMENELEIPPERLHISILLKTYARPALSTLPKRPRRL